MFEYPECVLDDLDFGPDDGMGRTDPGEYLTLSDDELRKECANAKSEKIVGIRNWPHKLSEKQRWCLAMWAAERDDRATSKALLTKHKP